MIELQDLTAALCTHISAKTGIAAYSDSTKVHSDRAFVVSCVQESLCLIDSGRQAERTVELVIHAYAQGLSRQEGSMVPRLLGCLLPYVSLCGRHLPLHDCNITKEADCERFSARLFFCDDCTVPQDKPPHMESLRFDFTAQQERKE